MLFYLIHPLYPFGGKFLGDSNSSFRIQTDPWHQGHSIISQLQNTKSSIINFSGKKKSLQMYQNCVDDNV